MWEAHMADDAAAATTATDNTTAEPAKDDAGKTFTQDQVNDLIAKEKGKFQSRYGDYDDLKARAAKLDELESANATELEKSQGKLTKAEQRAETAEAKLLRYEVATDKNVSAKLVPLLTASSKEDLEVQADLILENAKSEPTPDFDGGPREPPPEPKTPEQQHNESALAVLGLKPNT